MRPFFWKIVLCLTPCLLAGWVTTNAILKYVNGESGGFKLGVDLVGGTILVYEIDMRKQLDQDKKFDAGQDTNLLASSLKRRIDPNDLYNITIRPAGGEGRVEIILPTGGVYRAQKAEEAWNELLNKMKEKYGKYGVKDLDVGRGRILELAERIHMSWAEEIWAKELFGKREAWNDLLKSFWDKVPELWPSLLEPVDLNVALVDPASVASTVGELGASGPVGGAPLYVADIASRTRRTRLEKVPVGDLKEFVNVVQRELGGGASEKVIETWIKDRAWDQLLDRARKQWPELKDRLLSQEMEQQIPPTKRPFGAEVILPDSTEQLIGFIQTHGSVLGQAALASVEKLVGNDVLRVGKDKKDFVDPKVIKEFIEKNYGPSLQGITDEITSLYQASGRSKDLTLEEVQRIKDLVAKVGSLEFRILANSEDDKAAEKDAETMINELALSNTNLQQELKDDQERGLPPPGPREGTGKEPKIYDIELPRSQKSKVTYSWVELGPQERRMLGLDNAAEFDPSRNQVWLEAKIKRGKATKLKEPRGTTGAARFLLQGALFYSRKCEDRNMPEEERRQKAVEYFVLTRDPEIDPKVPSNFPLEKRRTPKIDGSYLRSAMSGVGSDLRPAVHFAFTDAGGNLFGDLTRKNVPSGSGSEETQIKRHLAIVLDGQIMSAPTINSEIRTQGQITGSFTKKEVDSLVNILRAGALPASLKQQPVSESTMGATLGQDTIRAGVIAVLAAFFVVLLFMIFYYRFAGFVASIALLANLLLTVGFMVSVQATFTLPGLAGLVLMLGMAVDANVLIYERLREERERGANLGLAIRNGYDRALPTIIDTHLTGIFTAIVLYVVGNDQLKGFGVSLTAGLIISLFTSLFMTRLTFDIWLARKWLHKLSMLRLFARPDIDFMGVRYFFFTLTLVVSILGIGVFIGRLPNDLDIDFVGGTLYEGKLVKAIDLTKFREFLTEEEQKKRLQLEEVKEEPGSDGRRFELLYKNPDGSQALPRIISLANKIEAPTEAEREKIFAQRATHLPDISVEQLFPSFDPETKGDKSRLFDVRTSEKEPELVQAALDRLLREADGQPVLDKLYMWVDPMSSTGTHLRFYSQKPPADFNPALDLQKPEKDQVPGAYGSPSFVKTLLTRELVKAFGKKDKDELPFQFELIGEGKTQEGRYKVMRLKFSEPLREAQLASVKKALDITQREFEARPQPERLENFDSQLASETRFRAMWAVFASWGAIALYLWFRFGNWTFGLAAVICLIHDLFFTLGVVAASYYIHTTWFGQLLLLEDFKINLPAVAALLTLVGYSVNDTIVVFDRIREVRGKNPDLTPQMINDSVNQTLSRTLLTSFLTWLVVVVLYIWGGPGVHLFAFVMVVGVAVGTYSSIYIASPLLLILGEGSKSASLRPQRQPQPRPESAPV